MLLVWFSMFLFSITQTNKPMSYTKDSGIHLTKSPYTFHESVDRLVAVLKKHQIQIFAHVDHSNNAKQVNEPLEGNYLIVFGNPLVGTKLMQQNPAVGLELPLKILVFVDNKQVYFAYRDFPKIADNYGLNSQVIIEKIHKLMAELVIESCKK